MLLYILCKLHDVWLVSCNTTSKIRFYVQSVTGPKLMYRSLWYLAWIMWICCLTSSASFKQIEWRYYYYFIFIIFLYLYSAYYSVDSKRLWHSFLICTTLINLRPLGAILARRRWGAHATVPDTLCGEGTTEPYPFRDVGSFTCPGMALPVHGTSIYSMMRTAPYSILSMPSAWQGSSMYHF